MNVLQRLTISSLLNCLAANVTHSCPKQARLIDQMHQPQARKLLRNSEDPPSTVGIPQLAAPCATNVLHRSMPFVYTTTAAVTTTTVVVLHHIVPFFNTIVLLLL